MLKLPTEDNIYCCTNRWNVKCNSIDKIGSAYKLDNRKKPDELSIT